MLLRKTQFLIYEMKNWIVKFEIYLDDLYRKEEIQGRILETYLIDGHMTFFILGENNKFYEILGTKCTLISISENNQNTERSERILNNHSTS